jgi:hypothetical protein
MLESVWPVLLGLIVASFLYGIGVAIGLILLIVPGLIVLTWWAVVAPVIVIERAGIIEAFGRSRRLVDGNGWIVLAAPIMYFDLREIEADDRAAQAAAAEHRVPPAPAQEPPPAPSS